MLTAYSTGVWASVSQVSGSPDGYPKRKENITENF